MTATLSLLEWAGCVTGILGALLLALNNHWSKWGYAAFFASNICWLAFGLQIGSDGLVWMQSAFLLTTLIGICRWLLPMPAAKNGQVVSPLPVSNV